MGPTDLLHCIRDAVAFLVMLEICSLKTFAGSLVYLLPCNQGGHRIQDSKEMERVYPHSCHTRD